MSSWPQWYRTRVSNTGVKYTAYSEPTNKTNAITGYEVNEVIGECTRRRIHSRGPGSSPGRADGSARSARVTGAPSTSSTGTNMFSVMCSPMCTLNIADP